MLLFCLAFLFCIILPGQLAAGRVLPGWGFVARLPVAAVLGVCLLMGAFVLLGSLGLPVLSPVPGLVLGLYWLVKKRKGFRGLPHTIHNTSPAAVALLLLALGLVCVYGLAGVLTQAKPHVYGHYFYNMDTLWSVGNAAAVQWGYPLRDIHSVSGVLHYHYLSDAVAGLLALFTRQSAWDAVCYYVWPLWAGLLLLALYTLGRSLGAGRWQALLLPLSASLLHGGLYVGYLHFFENPNGVLQSYLFLTVCIQLFLQLERARGRSRALLWAFAAAVLVLVWAKGTTGLLFLLGILAAVCGQACLRRRVKGRLLLAVGCGFGVFAALFAAVLAGGMTQVVFDPGAGGWRVVGGYLADVWPLTLLYLASALYALKRIQTLPTTVLALHAIIVGGAVAAMVFTHYGSSQYYFLFTGIFLMWICVLEGLVALRGTACYRYVRVFAAVLAALCLFPHSPTLVQTALGGLGVARHVVAGGEGELFGYTMYTVSAGDEAAALWLQRNMQKDVVFATNRQHRMERGGDGLFYFYTAMSERQCYMEGWQYPLDYSTTHADMIYQSDTVSDKMFHPDTGWQEACAIAKANGIDYLVLHLATRYDRPFAGVEPVFASEDVLVYKVP